MQRLVIIGAGTMGVRICRHFSTTGFNCALIDPVPEALGTARVELREGNEITFAANLDDLRTEWKDAAVVIEAVPERLDLKRQVIADLERFFTADTIIASNTSGLATAELTSGMAHPERFVITHFFNPADLIPAVEVVPAEATKAETTQRIATILAETGKQPAILQADIPGFIANRLQHAMLRECFHLIERGVADAQTIDTVTRYSIGVRLALNGPLMQRDLNGLDTHLNIARYLYPDLSTLQRPPELLEHKVARGETGRKSGIGFYNWDDAQKAQADEKEQLLDQLVSLVSAQNTGSGV
ncbi:3-hydroxyacyl-CoA dehydrogenase NAD-binding domain-containing protein [Paracoccus albus]|uniref:3-hydroxyacyl-CoA dehydrogenase NAD-binding domain-containing protein n=1 Tax=Paracoccus albus TaxID=3017784 RepID=UPI0022F02C71|nr:3-hydroxyacyl-CoA dehydrogenase NAD-binding domain-containing protein [Paracoccus albus]WBU61675.1 3-hydroxyacyl-CoA dehydrogenase NAD-binding domain-containing protein [Paracoccus albus]